MRGAMMHPRDNIIGTVTRLGQLALAALMLVSFAPGAASAATISGTITDGGGAGIPMQVRLWSSGSKGYEISTTVTAAANGTYSFTNVSAGTYKVDARMPPMFTGNYGDRWYDQAPPIGNGWIAVDADELVVTAMDTLTNIDITMPVNGGLDGSIILNNAPRNGVYVRVESTSDYRLHHEHISKFGGDQVTINGLPTSDGRFIMRGLPPG